LTADEIFTQLWQTYCTINPEVQEINDIFKESDEFRNDHIALRTFAHPKINIDVLAKVFTKNGYQKYGEYHSSAKKLDACHFEHPSHPKVFISEFDISSLSDESQEIAISAIESIPDNVLEADNLVSSGRHWGATYANCQKLLSESEYAAWVYAFGFTANHFTVFVNDLKSLDGDILKVNQLVKDNGFKLNSQGGEVKGSKAELLEQSSTMARKVKVEFDDRSALIPGCYYEFAKRHLKQNGDLFHGFVTNSADKIFESTNTN
jgi:hypothetical protein